MNVRRCFSVFLLVCLGASVLLPGLVEAAALTLTVRAVDASQFPKVSTTISLVDSLDVPPPGLDQSAVSMTEDNVPVGGVQIEPTIDPQQAYAVAVLIDTGSTMNDAGKLAATKAALGEFIDALGPQDSMALLSFSDQVKVLQGYTGDKDALKQAVGQLKASGPSAVYDAISQASGFQAVISQKRKVLLVLADGGDTASKQSLNGAATAARNAHVPIYAIGLGPDVHKDMLDQLSGLTSGQVGYVASADGLQAAFRGFADRLRRLFILSYTSKVPGDGKSHNLSLAVKLPDQALGGQGTFVAKSNALDVQVSGIVNATRVSAVTPITATVNAGKATSVQLLVDGQSRGSITTAPFVFNWDTTKETPGIHRVVIRATGADNTPIDREFIVEVLAPTPTGGPPTVAPTSVPLAAPTAVATPAPPPAPPAQNDLTGYLIGAVVAIVLVGAAVVGFVLLSRRRPAPKLPPPAPVVRTPPTSDDRTEVILKGDDGKTSVAGATVVLGATPTARQPRGRVRLLQQGGELDIVLTGTETIFGRDQSNPIVIRDAQASRRHGRIFLDNGEFWFEDLKSLNGTRFNGELTARHKLVAGDQLKIGEAVMTFYPEPG